MKKKVILLFSFFKKKPKRRKNTNLFETFTKIWVSILLIAALIDLQFTYVLALLGRVQIAETLSIAIVTEILGVSIAYFVRAYFDSKSKGKQDIEMKKLDIIALKQGLTSTPPEEVQNEEELG